MATKRKTLSKKTRFEVFKRDSFKCQYCGASAPDAILEVDHIDPISKDGADEMVNYITACRPCNAGKSDRKLDDNTTLAKQKAQLDELNERREQLEMMMSWRKGMKDIGELQIEEAKQAWRSGVPGWALNDKGVKDLKGYIAKYGLAAVLSGIDKAHDTYVKLDSETGNATAESVNLAWAKVGGILAMANLPEEERSLHYVKGILRNRLNYVPYNVVRDLKHALMCGVSVDDMKLEAKHTSNWTAFSNWLDSAIEDANGQG